MDNHINHLLNGMILQVFHVVSCKFTRFFFGGGVKMDRKSSTFNLVRCYHALFLLINLQNIMCFDDENLDLDTMLGKSKDTVSQMVFVHGDLPW